MIINLYNKLFGRKFFYKVFIIYSLVTVCAIMIVAYMASLNIDISLKNRERDNNEKILASTNAFFEQKLASSRNIIQNIYTSNSLHTEILYLMTNGYNKHLEYKLNKLLSSPDSKYNGFESYFKSWLYRETDIIGICIYSNLQPEAFVYSNTGRNIYQKDSYIVKYLDKSQESNHGITIIPSHIVHYLDKTNDSWAFTVAYQVKDTFSSDIAGYITIDYALYGIENEFIKYAESYKGTVLILTGQGETIFDSSGLYYNNAYPYAGSLKNGNSNSDVYINNIVNTIPSVDSNSLAAAVLPKQLLLNDKYRTGRTIFFISFACIAATLLLTYITMLTFSKRIGSLMAGIKNIKSGDFSSRIVVKNKQDEISEIALSFNNMCDNINEYIQKVYISDIKQKNAQLKALQAQINPHFLYNTLESIRMRALVRGAKDVADMVYLLSTLFRNSVKDKFIIRISEEIEQCKMYLELFNMRFMDRVKVTFDIKEDVMNFGIIKHSIQPLIENYVLHGIDTERSDNLLTIRIFNHEEDIYIYVIDNGTGIKEENLSQIKQSLQSFSSGEHSGLGLTNVNERIMLLFGNNYGMDIHSEDGKGTVVMIKYPARTREELEKNVQSVGS